MQFHWRLALPRFCRTVDKRSMRQVDSISWSQHAADENERRTKAANSCLDARPEIPTTRQVELAKALGRKSGVRMNLNETLRELEQAGEIARIRKNRYVLPSRSRSGHGNIARASGRLRFLSEKSRASRIYSSPRRTPAPPCTGTASLRGSRATNSMRAPKAGAGRRGRPDHQNPGARPRHHRRHGATIAELFLRGAGRPAHRPQRLRVSRKGATGRQGSR